MQPATGFAILRLNLLEERSWAVIRRETGAIALDAAGRLIFRMSKSEAEAAARALEAERPPTDAPGR